MAKSNPLERAFQVLDAVAAAGREMSLVDIVNAVGLPQSTTFRLTSSLVESGMLAFDHSRKLYSTGSRSHRFAFFLRGHHEISNIVLPALELLSRLAGETAFFVRRGRGGLRLLRYVVPEIGAQSFIHPGFEFPAHATAAGKAISAFLDAESLQSPADQLTKYQDATVTDQSELAQLLSQVRANGYATNSSELDLGVFSMAAPVLLKGMPVGALGIVGPAARLEHHPSYAPILAELIAQANSLSHLIGGPAGEL